MAYTEPGVIVRQELAAAGVVIQSADQDPVIVGELYEVFEERAAATRYSALTGAGAQVFAWPGKKLTSIVDLAGIRADTAEPDDQLRASAKYPMVVELQDPTTLVKTTLNVITDIVAVGQAGFSIVESVAAAVAKANAADATGAESNKIRKRTGGFVNAGIKIGDKIRIVLQHVTGGPVTIRGNVTAVTDTEITYVATNAPSAVVDDPTLASVDGDAVTTPGRVASATGGFTVGVTVGDRVAIWTEAAEVDDANGTVASTISTVTGLALTAADIGRKVSIGSAVIADGAVTDVDGATNGTNTFTGTGITAALKGRVIRIAGGTASLPATYRRVTSAGVGTLTFSGGTLATSTGCSFTIYAPVVRKIVTVVSATQFTYSGASLHNGLQVNIPVILHTRVLRDVSVVNSDSALTYSGAAVTSVTGFLLNLPFDIFKADAAYQIFADYQVLVSYRALDVTLAAGVRVAQPSEITALGAVSKYNPLLFAADRTLSAMGTDNRNLLLVGINPWFAQITPSGLPGDRDESGAYSAALEVLTNDPAAYFTAPLTRNAAVRDAFVAHAQAMSQPLEKRERSVHLSYALPLGTVESTAGGIEPGLDGGNKKILDLGKGFIATYSVTPGMRVVITAPAAYAGTYEVDAATTDDVLVLTGANWTQTLEPATPPTNADFDAVSGQVTSATTDVFKDVDVGDWIKRGTDFRRVSAKINNQTLAYSGVALTGTAQTVSYIRSSLPPDAPVVYYVNPLTKTQQASALKAISQARANFRVVNVWPDVARFVTGQDNAGNDVVEDLESFYLAAMEAGRDAVLRPERSSTGTALGGVVGLKNSNDYFSTTQLNTIAEGGWAIFVQPTPGGNVEMRHLLSTDRSSIKRQEFSVTKNVDNQAKVIRATLKPSLNDDQGRVNITQKLLDALMLPLQGVLNFFVNNEQLVVGPNGEQPYKIQSLYQDPDSIDTIKSQVAATEPIPGNTLDITYVI